MYYFPNIVSAIKSIVLKPPHTIFQIISCFLLLGLGCLPAEKESTSSTLQTTINKIPDQVDFIFHVKPILSDKCFKCHGPDEQKVEAGLQLHTKELAFAALGKAKDHFAIVPYKVEQSTLIERIYSDDPAEVMPPPESNLELSENEKALLKRWIEQGAEWKLHWAFTPPKAPAIPKIKNVDWASNPIDHFILQKLESLGLDPSPTATSEKLLRRLSFDLRGLPPSIEEINTFKANPTEAQYEKFVDAFMASDAFAERMTNEWLDLARYADSHGYQDDLERVMWPWRDWVIHAFKQNIPYDQFIRWQLAGDLLPNPTKEQIIATGFNRNHKITQEGGVISEEYRAEYVTDRTNTFGTAFLGLTMECAKCHDHKYDPISQKEYFQLYSFFNNVAEKGLIEVYGQTPKPFLEISDTEIEEVLTFIQNLDTLERIELMVMEELDQARSTYVLDRGLYDQPKDLVKPGVPAFNTQNTDLEDYQNRLDLADWLFEAENPLFARVTVNRIWQQFFGKGIVPTTNDFGNQGALPSHPELLDHLAVKFRTEGWDLRALIKYMVLSSTYKQESSVNPTLLAIDPDNKWLARMNRSRLSAEMIRDHALSISGLLVKQVGGPSVKPYQPEGLWSEVAGEGSGSTKRYVQDEGSKNYRRSLYTFWKRTVPPPNMMLFDATSRDFCTVQREQTSTPLQALVLLNDPQYLEISIAMAERALQKHPESPKDAIQFLFQLATSRAILQSELDLLLDLYQTELTQLKADSQQAEALLKYKPGSSSDVVLAAHSYIANTILNLDETIRKS